MSDDERCAAWLASRPDAMRAARLSYEEQRDTDRQIRGTHPYSSRFLGLVASSSDRQGLHRRCLLRVPPESSLFDRTEARIDRILALASPRARQERDEG